MRTKVDFSITAKIMLGIIRENSKKYNVNLGTHSAFISGILNAVLFLERVWHNQERHQRASRMPEAMKRLSQKEQMDSGLGRRGRWIRRCL